MTQDVNIHSHGRVGHISLDRPKALHALTLDMCHAMSAALSDWAGDEVQVRKLGCQYRAINQKDDVLTCVGTITAKRIENGEHLVDLTVDVKNQEGKSTAPGEATVALPTRNGG